MGTGPARRLSQRSTARKPNKFFAALSTELHSVLVDGALPPAPDLSDYYVIHRLSPYSPLEKQHLLDRMPVDVLALASGKSAECSLVDFLELDLIDFLLHYKNNRVISIIARSG